MEVAGSGLSFFSCDVFAAGPRKGLSNEVVGHLLYARPKWQWQLAS